jgi:hypothetical protein
MRQNETLSDRQIKAIAVLSQGGTREEAAIAAKVARSTVQRWLSDSEEFRDSLQWARQEAYESIIAKLVSGSGEAIATLLEICTDRKQAGGVRVAASRAILEIAVKGALADDLNRAISVCRKFDFAVIDLRKRDKDD